jgi:release factor glutamine methyltransferase
MQGTSRVSELLADAARHIDRRDAELLLAAKLGLSRTQLLLEEAREVPEAAAQGFTDWVRRRARGEPVAYLLGQREFWSLTLDVSPAVLVPRPETELLVERVLTLVDEPHARVADLGTGSGAIALALASERRGWRVVATDRSADALAVARANGDRLGVTNVQWREGDWFAPLATERYDAIASNPPYVAGDDPVLESDGLRFEPRSALTPGGDGFASLDILVAGAPRLLVPGGWLVLEHGTTQGETLRARLVARGFAHVRSHRDLAGHERISEGQWPL